MYNQNMDKNKKIIMAIVGAYLIYTGYNLVDSVLSKKPENMTLFLAVGVLFAVAGAVTVILNIKSYIAEVKSEFAEAEAAGDAEEEELTVDEFEGDEEEEEEEIEE